MTIENFHLCLSEIYAIGFPEELFRQVGFTLTNPPTELTRVGLQKKHVLAISDLCIRANFQFNLQSQVF